VGLFILNFGVLEYWSVGVLAEGMMFANNTPVLRHADFPRSKFSNYIMRSYNCLFIGYRSVIFSRLNGRAQQNER